MPPSLYPRAKGAPDTTAPEPWVDIHGAAAHLGVTVRWLYAEGDRAGVPCSRLGSRQRRYQLSRLSTFMESREAAA